MSTQEAKELEVRPKQEVDAADKSVRSGPVFTPDVDIFETEKELTLLADLPGVAQDSIEIDLREGTLTIDGHIADAQPAADQREIHSEYAVGRYHRQFSLSEAIDQSRIDAQLENGVLQLTLPKVASATPRKITVKAA